MLRQPDCISQVFQLVLPDEHCDRPFFYSLTPHLSPASEPDSELPVAAALCAEMTGSKEVIQF